MEQEIALGEVINTTHWLKEERSEILLRPDKHFHEKDDTRLLSKVCMSNTTQAAYMSQHY